MSTTANGWNLIISGEYVMPFGDGELAQMLADALDTLSPDGELRQNVAATLANAFSEVSEELP